MIYFLIAALAGTAALATHAYSRHRQRRERRSVARHRLSRTMAGARAGVAPRPRDRSGATRGGR